MNLEVTTPRTSLSGTLDCGGRRDTQDVASFAVGRDGAPSPTVVIGYRRSRTSGGRHG